MRKALLACVGLVSFAVPSICQNCPPLEVYGQYSFMNIDTKQLTPRQSANGWQGGAAVIFTRSFAAEFEVSGYYNNSRVSSQTINVNDYYFLGGPRVGYKFLFVHALFGGDHLSDAIFSSNVSQQGFAMALGGGAKLTLKGPWAIKGSFDYLLSRHAVFNTSSFGQNNLRASIGIAYTFGYRSTDMR
ncbi:MAG TPA: outer membrane beta-barrel protein [Terriglobales bacterium]|nr:outer membrane beta-barrel protein [Terriglobales bacterium]